MEYMVGCNYWGSKHGIDMWKYWDEDSVRRDLKELSKYGVKYLRVFPNWRDFQPVQTLFGQGGREREFRFADDVKTFNEFGLDMTKIAQFETFCDIAKENGIKLIVAILTGWMSGRLYAPPVVAGKNLISDPEALAWESRFVRGFVRHLKHREEIVYWDIGNECNNLGNAQSVWEAYMFTANVRNSILAEDHSRQIMSGMHGLGVDCTSNWHIQEQSELTDVLTPHPYPSPTTGGHTEPINRIKTSLLPTAQLAVYNGVGRKPVMIQEQGSFNDLFGDEETKSQWMEVNLWSGWANGSLGYLWWCAHDQQHLLNPPNCWSMIENELGILKGDYSPKPCAFTMKKVGDAIKNMPFGELPKSEIDAVCVIPYSEGSYMYLASSAYVLAKQAGINMTFVYSADYNVELPDAKLYVIPGSGFWTAMDLTVYNAICEKVKNGASLLVTTDVNTLAKTREVFGISTKGVKQSSSTFVADFGDYKLPISYGFKFLAYSVGAEVLAKDDDGTIIFSKYNYGKGKTYFLNCPVEKFTFENTDSYISYPYYKIYQTVAEDILKDKPAISNDPNVCLTIHPKQNDNEWVVVAVNYSDKDIPCSVIKFKDNVNVNMVYGDGETIPACSAFIYEIKVK